MVALLDFAVREIHTQDTLVVRPLVQHDPLDGAGIFALHDDDSVIHPHEPGEAKGHHRNSTVGDIHESQNWEGCTGTCMDPLDSSLSFLPRSYARGSDCQGPSGRAYKKPSLWVARLPAALKPTRTPTIGWVS